MTEKEQIAEMVKIIDEMYNVYITIANIAEGLYNAGYRKIDDDCAVITKDELKQYKAQAVKEFAESIIKELWDMWIDNNGKQFKCGALTSKDVWRIAKKFGVEVEE